MTAGRADLVDDERHGTVVEWQPAGDRDPVRIHPVWLLESCVCERCRYSSTGRRRQEALLVPTDLRPLRVWAEGGYLHAEWPDGHRSVAVGSAAVGSLAVGSVAVEPARGSVPVPPSDSFDSRPTAANAARALSATGVSDLATLSWGAQAHDEFLDAVRTVLSADGAVVVTGVPTSEVGLLELARRFGPVRTSDYGEAWAIETLADAEERARDAVTSLDGLSPHTDLPYRPLPPGVQFMLSCVADGVGGASTLVDGRRVVEQLDADDLRTLVEVPVRYGFGRVEEPLGAPGETAPGSRSIQHEHVGPVVEFDADGVLSVLRHAPGLIEDFDPDPDAFARLHGALSRLTALTNDPANQVVHRLEPGQLLIFDNHRMLHGRTPVELAPGQRRHLLGWYMDRESVAGVVGAARGQSS